MTPAFRYTGTCLLLLVVFASCSPAARIGRAAKPVLEDSALSRAHVGISIYDPAKNKVLYEHQANKFFVPASNTKLFTMYAGMKYLGDSIAGIRYFENDTAVFLLPTGDPGFLHSDYDRHPVLDFLQQVKKPLYLDDSRWKTSPFGTGWSWGDYNASYAPERSAFPAWGNTIRWVKESSGKAAANEHEFDQSVSIYSIPDIDWPVRFDPESQRGRFYVLRDQTENNFLIRQGSDSVGSQSVPYMTNGSQAVLELLNANYNLNIQPGSLPGTPQTSVIYSRHTDSLLKPLMHRSDNLYAEQVMLMVAEKLRGVLDESPVLDSLIRTELADIPGNLRWADGSGLSKNNQFTPQSMIAILKRLQDEFGMDRVRAIMATGGEGTIRNFYQRQKGSIYAKTGTLGGVVALSGYLYTKKNRLLLFSVLVNNHRGNANAIRRQVEQFIDQVYERY